MLYRETQIDLSSTSSLENATDYCWSVLSRDGISRLYMDKSIGDILSIAEKVTIFHRKDVTTHGSLPPSSNAGKVVSVAGGLVECCCKVSR